MHPKNEKEAGVQCPTFQKQEPGIKKLTDSINQAGNVHEKAGFAQQLQNEVGVLLGCPDYKSERADCRNCHFLATLRKKTADLIIMVKKLA